MLCCPLIYNFWRDKWKLFIKTQNRPYTQNWCVVDTRTSTGHKRNYQPTKKYGANKQIHFKWNWHDWCIHCVFHLNEISEYMNKYCSIDAWSWIAKLPRPNYSEHSIEVNIADQTTKKNHSQDHHLQISEHGTWMCCSFKQIKDT